MPPYLGGHKITQAAWIGTHALRVRFSSTWGATYLYQLYGGRTMIGVTDGTSQRTLIGSLQPATWPEQITLLAVTVANRLTDYGPSLPPRPYNRAALYFTPSGYPADAKYLDVFAGTTPGGAVDATNRIGRLLYDTDREYEFRSKPLAGSGAWNFEIKGTDGRPAAGNTGPALALSQSVLAHPPDVQSSSGNRSSVTVAAGTATVTFVRP